MLTQERYNYILQALEQRKAVSVAVLTKELNISESTIRRDLNALAKMGKLNKMVSIIILIILIPILFVNGVILVNSFIHPDEIPSFFGWKPFIVLSGSMETEIDAGDVAVVKETDTASLKKGDIIGQGIIHKYEITDDDTATGNRVGGFGSTSK